MHILTLDIGNSRISAALFNQNGILMRNDVPAESILPESLSYENADAIVISCVSAAHRNLTAQLLAQSRIPAFELSAAQSPIQLHYDHPERLGADRIANVLAAHALSPQGAIVVDLGTATHFDICDADGSLYAGPILPGLETMHAMLTARIPHLPHTDISTNVSPIVRCTENGIQAGCIYATAGAIERICREITALQGSMPICLTGGHAQTIAPLVKHDMLDPDLTMRGLYFYGVQSLKNRPDANINR